MQVHVRSRTKCLHGFACVLLAPRVSRVPLARLWAREHTRALMRDARYRLELRPMRAQCTHAHGSVFSCFERRVRAWCVRVRMFALASCVCSAVVHCRVWLAGEVSMSQPVGMVIDLACALVALKAARGEPRGPALVVP